MSYSPSTSVWRLNGIRFVLDPENRTITSERDDMTPVSSQFDRFTYGALSGYIIENGELDTTILVQKK